MAGTEVRVPDIGDFKDVEVIEVLVKPGDAIAKEQSLITLESDKATMEIPSPDAGVVKELRIKVGDKVSKGSPILLLEAAAKAEAPARAPAKTPEAPRAAAPTPAAGADVECDVLVLGAGPGGYSAAFRAADLGMKTVLVERYPTLGGVCLNVGCIPSKALLHTAAIMDAATALKDHGVTFGAPKVDLEKLRVFKNKVVGKLTGGLASMAKMRKVTVVQGSGKFTDRNTLEVNGKPIRFANAIIAAGSQAAKLPFLPEDPRIVDSTGALELRSLPKKLLVIGGGIIGLEMGTVYSTLGARLDVVEMMDGLMLGADRDLVAVWQKFNAPRFEAVMLKTKTTRVEATAQGLKATFEGQKTETALYDMILVSVGRVPNGKKIGADKAGVNVDERGFIDAYDPKTGAFLWHVGGPNQFPIPAPTSHDGIVYMSRGYRSGPYMAVRPGGRGDVSASHVVWQVNTGAPYISSLVYDSGLLYMANDVGAITVVDAHTGNRVWQERVDGVFSASPVAADGKIYFVSETGETIVLRSGREPRIIARNDIGERLMASPAVSNGQIFLRGDDRLVCVELIARK